MGSCSSSTNVDFTISNNKYKATLFYNKNAGFRSAHSMTFEIWGFQIYFQIKNYKVVENTTMIKKVVYHQKLLKSPRHIILEDIQDIVTHIVNEKKNADYDYFTSFVLQIIVWFTAEILDYQIPSYTEFIEAK